MWELDESESFFNYTNRTFNIWKMECVGSWPSITVQLVLFSLILVSSLVGNVLVVAVVYRDKTLRTSVNYFIVNMTISDLSIHTISVPVWIVFTVSESLLFDDGIVSTILCKVSWIVWGVSVLVSIFSMTALAADRFRAIIFPIQPALFSKKRRFVAIAVMWISSFALFGYYAIDIIPDKVSVSSCYEPQWTSKEFPSLLLIFFSLVCLSVIVITTLYLKMTIFLCRQKNSLHLATEVVRKRAKRNRKVVTMLIIIVILFYAVWIPFYVMHFLSYINPNISQPCFFVWFTDYILPLLYSMINPLIYYIFNKKYRQGFKQILSCLWFFKMKNGSNSANISSRLGNGGPVNLAIETSSSQKDDIVLNSYR